MLDHVSLGVADLALSRAFYEPCSRRSAISGAMTSVGYALPEPQALREQALPFWIGHEPRGAALSGHVCFRAPGRPAVDAFHQAALAAGGRDNGKPGLRPHYHASYYAAFIIDPDGHRIEAVCHHLE